MRSPGRTDSASILLLALRSLPPKASEAGVSKGWAACLGPYQLVTTAPLKRVWMNSFTGWV